MGARGPGLSGGLRWKLWMADSCHSEAGWRHPGRLQEGFLERLGSVGSKELNQNSTSRLLWVVISSLP